MYFDRRLWQFTEGLRLRIAGAVLIGLLSAAVGIARLALLGWLLGRVFQGEGLDDLILPIVAVAAAMLARGGLEYWRTMEAHRTAASVQLQIRARLFDQIAALGPGQFGGQRSGEVLLGVIDGVEQLETYFGQYLPQLFVAAVTPFGIFVFAAFLDLPLAGVLLGFALLTLVAPVAFHHWDQQSAKARQVAYAAYGAELLDSVQGLATLKAFGQSAARGRFLAEKAHDLFRTTMWVLASNSASRGITDAGIAVGAAAALGVGAARVAEGAIGIEVLLIVLMMGVEVFRPMRDLRALLHTGMHGRSAAESLFRLLDTKPAIEDADDADDTAGLAPTIAFEDVHFAYPGGRRPAHDGPLLLRERRRAGGHRRRERRRQVDGLAPAHALRRPAGGTHPARRPRPAHARPRCAPRGLRRRQPGHVPVPRHGGGEHPLRQAGRERRRSGSRRTGGQRPRLHCPPGAGL